MEWTARAVDDATIDAGKIAEIIEIRGVKVIVKEKKEEQ